MYEKVKNENVLYEWKTALKFVHFHSTATFGFSAITLVSAFILSYPRLEKLAYVQFGALFENGSITMRKKLLVAIQNEDWDKVTTLTEEVFINTHNHAHTHTQLNTKPSPPSTHLSALSRTDSWSRS